MNNFNLFIQKGLFLILLAFTGGHLFAQELAVRIVPPNAAATAELQFHKDQLFTKDSLHKRIKYKLDSLRQVGYLAASIDSIISNNDVWEAHLYIGKQYKPGIIGNGNIDEDIYATLASKEIKNWKDVQQRKKSILQAYLDKGNLNAGVKIDDIKINGETIDGAFYINETKAYTFGEIIVSGDVDVTPNYLQNYFGVEPGQEIGSKLLQEIRRRANQSFFFTLENPPAFVLNTDGSADIALDLKQIKANQFDVILGFLPNPNPLLSDKKLLLTGEGQLDLYNPLGGGRRLNVAYHQLQPESPKFNLNFEWPYIIKNAVGLAGEFDLYKQDSAFVNVNYQFGGHYFFGGNNKFHGYFKRNTSFLQEVDTAFVRINQSLPPSIDYNQNLYGVELTFDKRDNLRSPKKGYRVVASPAVGNRTIESNRKVTEVVAAGFDYTTLYNGVNENKLTIQSELLVEGFIPTGNRSSILLKSHSGLRFYDQYFNNDLYRLGGINTIRGFDEESQLASKYSSATAEYRYFLGNESFVSVFSDGGYLYNERKQEPGNFLLGFGSGINLATEAGIFSLNLAVGKDNDTPLQLNRSRIHIGYINVF